MILTANLGYPRIGAKREIKKALENFWHGKITEDQLLQIGKQIRLQNFQIQQDAGIDILPTNDFSFYDHVLDTMVLLGAVPRRFKELRDISELQRYFAMARGWVVEDGEDLHAMEMTKWFNTNYHYIVPELEKEMQFQLSPEKILNACQEAREAGFNSRPVLLGPVSFLLLSKTTSDFSPLELLEKVLPLYTELLVKLKSAGVEWLQLDEPFLVMDLSAEEKNAYRRAYKNLLSQTERPKIMLTTYFGSIRDNLDVVNALEVEGYHLDLTSSQNDIFGSLRKVEQLSLGVLEARNIWRLELKKAVGRLKTILPQVNARQIILAPSASLMHIPQDVELETQMDAEVRSWLSFAKQKLSELVLLGKIIDHGEGQFAEKIKENKAVFAAKQRSARIHDAAVEARMKAVSPQMLKRAAPFELRQHAQAQIGLPLFPTTTIGSFPQTREVRLNRSRFNKKEITQEQYEEFIRDEIKRTIEFQEKIGLDVLVHGEYERNDMVQYFGEKLNGFAFTRQGWVQSYGSRYVRPPIIFGDVSRSQPMTVKWAEYAQSLTKKPVKGMLTGPLTILQWSYARDDQPRWETCRQIALAIRDEVVDLEQAGIKIIQIDEPAFREGLPLNQADRQDYLDWAVECFHISADGVGDATQIHTHMCYAEFNDVMDSIAAMDADVISIEASRSKMELLESFEEFEYPNQIGPGVYDIHSPLIPDQEQMCSLLKKAAQVLPESQIWVNPDCGLKTRGWKEVEPALRKMVEAAKAMREKA